MESVEWDVIFKVVDECGLVVDLVGFKMVELWFNQKLVVELFLVWKEYVGVLGELMDVGVFVKLKFNVFEQVKFVVEVVGGILGLVNKILLIE